MRHGGLGLASHPAIRVADPRRGVVETVTHEG